MLCGLSRRIGWRRGRRGIEVSRNAAEAGGSGVTCADGCEDGGGEEEVAWGEEGSLVYA